MILDVTPGGDKDSDRYHLLPERFWKRMRMIRQNRSPCYGWLNNDGDYCKRPKKYAKPPKTYFPRKFEEKIYADKPCHESEESTYEEININNWLRQTEDYLGAEDKGDAQQKAQSQRLVPVEPLKE